MKKLLIIGGVAAGATAAARARRLNAEVEIDLLESGEDVSFANCGLPYYLGGEVAHRSSLILSSPEIFQEQYRVTVHTQTEAIAIDRANKIVTAVNRATGGEKTFAYDKLILAQGGKPIVPPLPGVDRDNVFQLWTLADMDRIDRFLADKQPKSAVVVGAGFIGLEMVEALLRRGLQVSIVEQAMQVMPTLEGEIAGFLIEELMAYGVELKLGRSLLAIQDEGAVLDDGTLLPADFVLLSVGVKPTLQLAQSAGLTVGETGGLAVDEHLRTSDPDIYAAGDMAEITSRICGKKMRVPLAGPANRQGRIAAENALGGQVVYRGSALSSIVKIFSAVAGSTGLNLSQAKASGFDADAVVIHKASHTAYFPGAEPVTLQLVYEKESGRILGAQSAGRVGIDKQLDVIATAIAAGMTLDELGELDFAYAPPFNSPNGPVHMAAFAAENHRTHFSPVVLARDLERLVRSQNNLRLFDLRDPISFGNRHLEGSQNISQPALRDNMARLDKGTTIVLISDDGQKGHVVLRMLVGAGFQRVFNLAGGYRSLERQARAYPFAHLRVGLGPIVKKSAVDTEDERAQEKPCEEPSTRTKPSGVIIIDVRTPMEFEMGAVPDALNVPLDELPLRAKEVIGDDLGREVILYCASGARSAYGVRVLQQLGYTDVTNGGGLHAMMSRVSSFSLM
ncbi:MAG: FAD-dependent oxidoreductase [Proteobacteria bacterium]|nr:FAD-dependent oxidoreductase [Pseudomonadota bacterium]